MCNVGMQEISRDNLSEVPAVVVDQQYYVINGPVETGGSQLNKLVLLPTYLDPTPGLLAIVPMCITPNINSSSTVTVGHVGQHYMTITEADIEDNKYGKMAVS